MAVDLNDIFYDNNDSPDDQEIMNYLSNKLSPIEAHEIEKKIIDSEFVGDAVDGLKSFESQEELMKITVQLNENLNIQLRNRKKRKEKSGLKSQSWVLLTVIIVLLIILISFLVIRIIPGI